MRQKLQEPILFWRKKKADQNCKCGAPVTNGYSPRAESDWKNIESVCDNCLIEKLANDFHAFASRAIVFAPEKDQPCYIFRSKSDVAGGVPEEIEQVIPALLERISMNCVTCGKTAHFGWVDSQKGATSESQVKSLCCECCVAALKQFFPPSKFLEVCGPKDEDGVQLSMGY